MRKRVMIMTMAIMVGTALDEIGSGNLNQAVREGLFNHENNGRDGLAYYGTVTRIRAIVARQAFRSYPKLSDMECEALEAEFPTPTKKKPRPGFWLGAELSSMVFDALAWYASLPSVCAAGRDDVTVHGGFARGICDCKLRKAALDWAAEIATGAIGIRFAE